MVHLRLETFVIVTEADLPVPPPVEPLVIPKRRSAMRHRAGAVQGAVRVPVGDGERPAGVGERRTGVGDGPGAARSCRGDADELVAGSPAGIHVPPDDAYSAAQPTAAIAATTTNEVTPNRANPHPGTVGPLSHRAFASRRPRYRRGGDCARRAGIVPTDASAHRRPLSFADADPADGHAGSTGAGLRGIVTSCPPVICSGGWPAGCTVIGSALHGEALSVTSRWVAVTWIWCPR